MTGEEPGAVARLAGHMRVESGEEELKIEGVRMLPR